MMDLQTIHDLSRRAALQSARDHKVPFTIEQTDLDDACRGHLKNIKITNLGTRCPKGWRRVDLDAWFPNGYPRGVHSGQNNGCGAFFVDKSGWGGEGEAALTMDEFFKIIRPGFGYAVVEEGQFQCYVGVFEKIVPKPKREPSVKESRRIADHIDGFDRDDLGESPDF